MTKVVINNRYGGFGLSEAAIRRYSKIKGFGLVVEKGDCYSSYYIHEKGKKRPPKGVLPSALSSEERHACGIAYFHEDEIPRADPALVQVVEELGAQANGAYADLVVEDVPPGTRYRIDDYDGRERIIYADEDEGSRLTA